MYMKYGMKIQLTHELVVVQAEAEQPRHHAYLLRNVPWKTKGQG